MSRVLNDIGDPGAPVGSPSWCKYVHIGLREKRHRTQSEVSSLKWGLRSFREDDRYQQLVDKDGKHFTSWDQYVECPEPWGLGMRADIAHAVMEETDEAALVADVLDKAAKAKERDAKDRKNQRPAHRPKKSDDNIESDVITLRDGKRKSPTGNSVDKALRTLRDKRPDIHARVLTGELSAHAGMIEAGFRKKRASKKLAPFDHLEKWWAKASPDERQRFMADKLREMQRTAA